MGTAAAKHPIAWVCIPRCCGEPKNFHRTPDRERCLSKQWQDFFVLIFLIAGYLFMVVHYLRALRLPLPHGR